MEDNVVMGYVSKGLLRMLDPGEGDTDLLIIRNGIEVPKHTLT